MSTNHRWSLHHDTNASLLIQKFIMTPIITNLPVYCETHCYYMISPSSAEAPPWIVCAVCEKLSTCYPCKHHFGRDWPFSLSLIYFTLIHWLFPLQPHLERIVNNFCPDFPTPEEKQRVRMISRGTIAHYSGLLLRNPGYFLFFCNSPSFAWLIHQQ